MKASEIVLRKAGVIPYYISDTGQIMMKFYIPSDPDYGGTKPQIAKGQIDPGEDAKTAAVREGTEEVGLVPSNIVSLQPLTAVSGANEWESFTIEFFVAKVKDPNKFVKPGFEAKETVWMTPEQFAANGRSVQRAIVEKAVSVINQTLSQA